MEKSLIVFDMDGVLVDVGGSYRATIQATVQHFCGEEPSPETVQEWKNRGGYNDDWKLCHAMLAEKGVNVAFEDVVEHFQKLFHGDDINPGLMLREQWIAKSGLFERLAFRHNMAVFTGRLQWEAQLTLKRFMPNNEWPVVGIDDVERGKPEPEGLLKICTMIPHTQAWYVGDTVDDARAAAAASVPFIGIAAPNSPRRDELVALLQAFGAVAVIEDINKLEAVIAPNS